MSAGNLALSEVRKLMEIVEELLAVVRSMEQRITDLENKG